MIWLYEQSKLGFWQFEPALATCSHQRIPITSPPNCWLVHLLHRMIHTACTVLPTVTASGLDAEKSCFDHQPLSTDIATASGLHPLPPVANDLGRSNRTGEIEDAGPSMKAIPYASPRLDTRRRLKLKNIHWHTAKTQNSALINSSRRIMLEVKNFSERIVKLTSAPKIHVEEERPIMVEDVRKRLDELRRGEQYLLRPDCNFIQRCLFFLDFLQSNLISGSK